MTTGQGRSVRQFVQAAFAHAGLDWEQYVTHDEHYERPTEVDALIGDASKAREVLGWKAETDADQLAELMVDADIARLRSGQVVA